jgi:OpgC protein
MKWARLRMPCRRFTPYLQPLLSRDAGVRAFLTPRRVGRQERRQRGLKGCFGATERHTVLRAPRTGNAGFDIAEVKLERVAENWLGPPAAVGHGLCGMDARRFSRHIGSVHFNRDRCYFRRGVCPKPAALVPEPQEITPRVLFEAFNPNDKTNLAPYRILHLVILIIVVVRFIPVDAPGLKATIWRPLVKCGQHSLEVFCVGIYLSFIAAFILKATSDGIVAQFLVGAGGLSIMTAVAYYRSWSKRRAKGDPKRSASPYR